MFIDSVYIILYWLDMTKGDMDVYGLQNVIWPGFSSQLRWSDLKTTNYQMLENENWPLLIMKCVK